MGKKLIEVALPLDVINDAARRENQPFTRRHPRSIHTWWARRPLAACRAVLFAQLVDDPSSRPEEFPTEELQDAERDRLFGLVADLVQWENTSNEAVLESARAEIRAAVPAGTAVVDPFAGGGRIPMAAQRLGLSASASDLNPVAVLINRALVEMPYSLDGRPPVHPQAENRAQWLGLEGFQEDLRQFTAWMRIEASRRIGANYPRVQLPDGTSAAAIAWLWARTLRCPNPACGAQMPLVRSYWLSKKKGKEAWLHPVVDGPDVRFDVRTEPGGPLTDGSVGRSGAECVVCGESVKFDQIRLAGREGRLGTQLLAVVGEGDRRRVYMPANEEHSKAAELAAPSAVPESELPDKALGFRVQAYGMTRHSDLFTSRQLVALTALSDLVGEAHQLAEEYATAAGLDSEGAAMHAKAVATFLGLSVSRWADIGNAIAGWNTQNEAIRNLFARQAIPMTWDFAEANPLDTAVSWFEITSNALDSLSSIPLAAPGSATMEDARKFTNKGIVSTDPPYYDNVGYADLSDFFYAWLRRSLREVHPDLFATLTSPKADELIATPFRHGGSAEAAEEYFEDGFKASFAHCLSMHSDDFPMTVYYAFKQSERSASDGATSTGWSTMLEGLVDGGWTITATWPLRTERAERSVASGANALASSVVLACRPRPEHAGITDRQGLLRALREELPAPVRDLQKAAIAPVDLRQAAIGPGMAVFSRFARVVEPDGEPMRVRTALGLINQVLETVLGELEADFDPETRWAVQWFSQFHEDEGPFGTAESLAVSMNVSVDGLVSSGILESGGGKARLLSRSEMHDGWDPAKDDRVPVWEATQHLVRRLESEGEVSAARLFRQLGGMAESCKALAYRLYDVCESSRPNLAGPYNMLAASWPEIQRLAAQTTAPTQTAEEQQLDL